MAKRKSAVKIVQPEPPVAAEIMADAIVSIARGMKALEASRLKRETVVVLISDTSRLPKTTIRIVLNNLDDLESTYLKPKAKR